MIDLTNKRFTILGLQGSGKTELAKSFLRTTPDHRVYDPLGTDPKHIDYVGFKRIIPDNRNSVAELDYTVREIIIPTRPKLFVVDEANRYIAPKPTPLPPAIADLNDLSRHWGISWGLIARRPTQFHTDVIELCHYLFAFQLPGRNDRRFFDNIVPGLGHIIATLPQYHFVVIENLSTYHIHAPIDIHQKITV